MKSQEKSILIHAIIQRLNESIQEKNNKLCEQSLYSDQEPLHGGDMFFKLSYMSDDAIKKIALACRI